MAMHINDAFDSIFLAYAYFAINIQIYFLEYNIPIRFFGPVDSPNSLPCKYNSQ